MLPETPPPPLPSSPPPPPPPSSSPPPLPSDPPPDVVPLTPPPAFTDPKQSSEFYYREDGDGASYDVDVLTGPGEVDVASMKTEDPDNNEKMMCVEELGPVDSAVPGSSLVTVKH